MNSLALANFVNALFYVYYILIIVRVLFSWVRPSGAMIMIYRFVYDITEPYLGLFRRIIPMAGPMDFSPFIGLIVLGIIQTIVHNLILTGSF